MKNDVRITKKNNKFYVEDNKFDTFEEAQSYADENVVIYDKTFEEWYGWAAETYSEYEKKYYDEDVNEDEYDKDDFRANFMGAWKENRKNNGNGDDLWGIIEDMVYQQVL